MESWVEIAVCDASGRSREKTVRVPAPPPPLVETEGVVLELRRFKDCKQFGCGSVWEERLAYVLLSEPGQMAAQVSVVNEGGEKER